MNDNANLFQSFELRRERLHEQIALGVQQLIIESQIEPGARLPSERALAERFGVSRVTISEAIRSLEQRGLVERRVGDGTYVTDRTRSVFVESLQWLYRLRGCTHEDLMVLREMLEPDIAALAAERATPQDLALIKEYLEQTEESWIRGDVDAHAAQDTGFHEALAAATQNELLMAVIAGLQSVLRSAIDVQYRASTKEEGGIRSHRPIYEAIAAHDPVGAREAMDEHLSFTRLALRQADQLLLDSI